MPSRRFFLMLAAAPLAAAENPRRIQERFMAPCCWHENVAIHQSPTAEAMRAEIVKLVADGRTEAEIVEIYVARYGERILREPRGSRSFWLRTAPIGAAALGLAGLAWGLARMRRKAEPSPETGDLPPLPDDLA
jgi:cytochrome c-type biogenesis protein CcmH